MLATYEVVVHLGTTEPEPPPVAVRLEDEVLVIGTDGTPWTYRDIMDREG